MRTFFAALALSVCIPVSSFAQDTANVCGLESVSALGTVVSNGGSFSGQGPSSAFDGVASYYSGYSTSTTYLGRNFGAARRVRLIEAKGASSFSFYGRVRYSDDGVSFTDTSTIVQVPAGDNVWREFAVADYGAHLVWVVADLQDDAYHQIDELRLFATPVVTPTEVTLTTVGSVFATGGAFSGQGPENAFSAPGSWYSGYSSSSTAIGRDFGSPVTLSRIEAQGASSFSFYGRVLYSDDGTTFTDTSTVVNVPPGTSGAMSYTVGSYGAHRYWVVADLQDDGYLQVDELRLYGPGVPPPQTCRITDVFADAGAISGRNPITSMGSTWVLSGSPQISLSNGAAISGTGSDAIALIESTVSDGVVAADWIAAGSHGGIIARASDASNYLTAYFANHSVYLQRVEGGVYTELGVYYLGGISLGTRNRIAMQLSGENITVKWNGSTVIQATSVFNMLATRHGLRFWNQYDAASSFDNFSVDGPSQPTPTTVVIAPAEFSLAYNQPSTLTAQPKDATGAPLAGVSFAWSSSNPSAVTVVATSATTATVRAVGMGAATITATPFGGASGQAAVSVNLGTTMVADRFSGSNGTSLTQSAPQVNIGSTGWQVLSGPGIQLSAGSAQAVSAGGESLAVVNSGAADTTVSVNWTPHGSGPWVSGLAFRATNATNYWRAYWGTNGLFLQRVVNSVATTVASTFTIPMPAVDQPKRIEVRLNAHHIEVWWNGDQKLAADDAFNVTATRHGIWWATQYDHVSTFDDFEVNGQLPPFVSRVELSPVNAVGFTVPFARARTLTAVAYDAANAVIPNVSFAWTTSNPTSIGLTPVTGNTVNFSGLAMGSAIVTAIPVSGSTGSAEVSVTLGRVRVSDAFTDTTGVALTAHQPEVTQGSEWQVWGTPSIAVADDRAGTGSGSDALGLIEGGTSDGAVQANWHVVGTHAGVVFRATDESNYWLAYWGTNALYLGRYVNGVLENTRQVFLPVPGVGAVKRISVKLAGPKIEVWFDGRRAIEHQSDWNQTATKYGVRFYNQYDAASTLDNFQVLDPPVIASVEITPSFASFEVFHTQMFSAIARDTDGEIIPEVSFTFESSEADLVVLGATTETSVNTTGMGRGESHIRATAFGSTTFGTADAWVNTTNPSCVTVADPGFHWGGQGGYGQYTLIVEARCQVTVTSSDPSWLIPGPTRGLYRVMPNGSPWERQGFLSINGWQLAITQGVAVASPGCFNGFFPGAVTLSAQGGQRVVQVSAPPNCVWTAIGTSDWLHAWTSTGMGSGDLIYIVDPNEGAERSGTITVNETTFAVTQEAGPSGLAGGGGTGSGSGPARPGGSRLSPWRNPAKYSTLNTAAEQCAAPIPDRKGFQNSRRTYFRIRLDGITDEMRECVSSGIQSWDGTGGIDFVRVDGLFPGNIEVRFAEMDNPLAAAEWETTAYGPGGWITDGRININRSSFGNFYCGEIRKILAHEIGHGFGLPDVESAPFGSTIMHSPATPSSLPDNPSACDKIMANWAVGLPDVVYEVPTPPPGSDNCGPLGCLGTVEFTCDPGYTYDQGSGWCLNWELLSVGSARPNTPPNLRIASPSNGDTIGDSPVITVGSLDPDGRVVSVDFLVDGQYMATSTDHPFSWMPTGLPVGQHTITAVAHDNKGSSTTVSVSVTIEN